MFIIPPDWTIEILFPDQSTTKVLKNINHCLAHGTQMLWLIDPADRSVFICLPDRNLQIIEENSTILPVPKFARFSIGEATSTVQLTVEQLFRWVKKKI